MACIFISRCFSTFANFSVVSTIWGLLLSTSRSTFHFLTPIDWLCFLLMTYLHVPRCWWTQRSQQPLLPALSQWLRVPHWPPLSRVPEPGQGWSGHQIKCQCCGSPHWRWSVPVDFVNIVCKLLELAFKLHQLLCHPRKLLQKPLPIQLLFWDRSLLLPSQVSFQFIQIFV